MADENALTSQSTIRDGNPSDPILSAIERTQQQLLDLATADEPMTADRRRSLERQLKDLKDLARHHLDLARLAQEIQTQKQSHKTAQARRNVAQLAWVRPIPYVRTGHPSTPIARQRGRQCSSQPLVYPERAEAMALGQGFVYAVIT